VTHSSLPRQAPVLEQYRQTGKRGNLYSSTSIIHKILSRKHHSLASVLIDRHLQFTTLITTTSNYHYNTTTTRLLDYYLPPLIYQNDPRNRNHLHRTTPQLCKLPHPPYSLFLIYHTNVYFKIALPGGIPPPNPLPGENPGGDYPRRKPLLPSSLPPFLHPRIGKKEQTSKTNKQTNKQGRSG